MKECPNCGAPVYKAGRCAACYWYRRRHHGEERPEELIVRHGRRKLEARQEKELHGWSAW